MIPILTSFFVNLFRLGSSTGPIVTSGVGSPENSLSAPVGSIYSRTDGVSDNTIYRKESGIGNTGWIAISNATALGTTLNAVEVEIDFGYPMKKLKKFNIVDVNVVGPFSSFVVINQSGIAATGKFSDDNEFDQLHFVTKANVGSFDLYATCLSGRVGGKFKVTYVVVGIIVV